MIENREQRLCIQMMEIDIDIMTYIRLKGLIEYCTAGIKPFSVKIAFLAQLRYQHSRLTPRFDLLCGSAAVNQCPKATIQPAKALKTKYLSPKVGGIEFHLLMTPPKLLSLQPLPANHQSTQMLP
jgi:hypothetical protein